MEERSVQEVIGCLGPTVAGNPTQFVLERGLAAAGLDWRCLSAEVPAEQLEDAIRGLRALGFRGVTLMGPHKGRVLPYLDEITPEAENVAAVNVITREETGLVGDATEGRSFLAMRKQRAKKPPRHLLLLGAGFMARGIALAAAGEGLATCRIISRSATPAQQLAERLHPHGVTCHVLGWEDPTVISEETDLVVNATPVGGWGVAGELPLVWDSLPPGALVVDCVYQGPSTRLLREADARGCPTINGLDLFIERAALALETWTGRSADRPAMREALEEFLEV